LRRPLQRFLKSPLSHKDKSKNLQVNQFKYVLEEYQRTNPNFNVQLQNNICPNLD
jgi:hypothetical protein